MPQCNQCKTQFEITDADRAFYKKIDVPEPRQCPQCRLVRRLNERNHRTLYLRTCDKTGKQIYSQYHTQQPFPVWETNYWWSDKWDATEYGRDFDFSRPFFEQFKELKHTVPHPALATIPATIENSDYNNCVGYIKNCYLIAESDYNEDCYYSNLLKHCKDVCDCSVCYEDELCYECVDCMGCYNVKFSQDCSDCRDSYFLSDCQTCSDCMGCINQRGKRYMMFNEQLTKEEYTKRSAALHLTTHEGIAHVRAQAHAFFKTQPHKCAHVKNNQDSSGDHLYNSKNARHCFDSKDLEDCAYCAKLSLNVKSCMDFNSWGDRAELVYQSAVCGSNVYNIRFCTTSYTNLSDCTYCDWCVSSHDLFGCVGLNKKQYCILNKQCTRDEYKALIPRIIEHMKKIGEWGEFFPKDMCPYGYNESLAQEIFPLTHEEALKQGYTWQDNLPMTTGKETLQLSAIPSDDSFDTDTLAGQILACTACSRNYKLIKQELVFYKKMRVPVPLNCPNCRHANRMALRLPLQLWHRQCMCTLNGHGHTGVCTQEFETAHAPARPEKIFCEECYQKKII
ncbi:MAG TPA: hypothetical protein DDW36_00810 [Candidatus Magasanikbacteria bacterium]|nr:hypothetical protein [Candidatus Magasanikbacteria bacterium]